MGYLYRVFQISTYEFCREGDNIDINYIHMEKHDRACMNARTWIGHGGLITLQGPYKKVVTYTKGACSD